MAEGKADLVREPPQGLLASMRYLGPGFILSAAIVGSGELMATTALGANAGFAVLWVILFGCLIKVGVQLEFGRHCICHGVPAFEAWNNGKGIRVLGLRWPVYIGFLYIVSNLFGQGGVMGAASTVIDHVYPGFPSWVWVWLLALALAVLVFHGRYGPTELICALMNLLFVSAILYCVVAVQRTEYAFSVGDIAGGFSLNIPAESVTLALAAFGITGVGAGEIFVYPTWCVEKGYAAWTGENDGSQEWAYRARGWMRVMTLDAVLSMVVYTISTVAFYILGAAVLSAQGELQDGPGLVMQLSGIFTEVLGDQTQLIFIVCAFAVLFSTAFSNNASNSRLWADFLGLVKCYDLKDAGTRRIWVAGLAWALPASWALFYLAFEKPLYLVIMMGLANALFLPVVAYQALVYRYRETDPRVKPPTWYDIVLWGSIVSIGFVAVRSIAALFT